MTKQSADSLLSLFSPCTACVRAGRRFAECEAPGGSHHHSSKTMVLVHNGWKRLEHPLWFKRGCSKWRSLRVIFTNGGGLEREINRWMDTESAGKQILHPSTKEAKLKRKTLNLWSIYVLTWVTSCGYRRKEGDHTHKSTNTFPPQDVWALPQRWREKVRVRSWEGLRGEAAPPHGEEPEEVDLARKLPGGFFQHTPPEGDPEENPGDAGGPRTC